MSARVLITGATGFLGRPLVASLLNDGARITALARKFEGAPLPASVELLAADLTSAESARAALAPWRWDAVVNLAGPVAKAIERFDEGTVTATSHVRIALHLLRALPAGFAGRVVHTSSMTVYGLPAQLPVSEDAPRKPIHLYGLGKSLADEVLLAAPDGLDVWVLRLPGLFAPWRKGGALYHFARAARKGEPLRVTATDPIAWDILDVRDAVTAITRALASKAQRPGAVNVSYGEPVEIVAMAQRIAALAGRGSETCPPAGVIHPVFQLDIARARALLGWPCATLEGRLRELLETVEEP
jgi:UDP-glucose 4-epimerase